MNAAVIKILALGGILLSGVGCSSSESLREKYLSSDLRKAEEMARKKEKISRKVSSNYFKPSSLSL